MCGIRLAPSRGWCNTGRNTSRCRGPRPTLVLALGLALLTRTTYGGDIGHYVPGLPNLRDFAMPVPGVYGVLYNYVHTSERLNDGDGNKLSSITITPRRGPGVTLSVDVDVDAYALAPTLIWVSPWTLFGATYGAFLTPTFANTSVGASLATVTGRGIDAETSQFAVGDLFVVRVAGNIVSPANYGILGSIEYGVKALGVHLIMVLGHSRCGAVEGALKALQAGTTSPGAIEDIMQAIQPSVVKAQGEPGDLLQNAILENVRLGIRTLNTLDPVIAPLVKDGKVQVVGGNYDLVSGAVTFVV